MPLAFSSRRTFLCWLFVDWADIQLSPAFWRMQEGNVFTLFVCPHLEGVGTPVPGSFPGPFWGGGGGVVPQSLPREGILVLAGGEGIPVLAGGGGFPQSLGRGYLRTGVPTPQPGQGYPLLARTGAPPHWDWDNHSPPGLGYPSPNGQVTLRAVRLVRFAQLSYLLIPNIFSIPFRALRTSGS